MRRRPEEDVPLEQVQVGDRAPRPPGREGAGRRRRSLEGTSGRRVDGDRRADPGREAPRDSAVTGGTVNGTGSFVMGAERVGSDTMLAQIVALVSEAQRTRAPIQRLADVVAG